MKLLICLSFILFSSMAVCGQKELEQEVKQLLLQSQNVDIVVKKVELTELD